MRSGFPPARERRPDLLLDRQVPPDTSENIEELKDRFGVNFSEKDRKCVEHLEAQLHLLISTSRVGPAEKRCVPEPFRRAVGTSVFPERMI